MEELIYQDINRSNLFNKAERFDIARNYKQAIAVYNQCIQQNPGEIDAYLNLIGLIIMILFEGGVSIELDKNHEFSDMEWKEIDESLPNLISIGKATFNEHNEFDFWEYFYKQFYIYDEYSRNSLIEIINKMPKNPVPYCYLFWKDKLSGTMSNKYIDEIDGLKNLVKQRLTVKNELIEMLIDSE